MRVHRLCWYHWILALHSTQLITSYFLTFFKPALASLGWPLLGFIPILLGGANWHILGVPGLPSLVFHSHPSCVPPLWFCYNGVALNRDKSEAIILGTTKRTRSLPNTATVGVAGCLVQVSNKVKIFGIDFDSWLSFDSHMSALFKSCFYHIRPLRHIWLGLTLDCMAKAWPTDVNNDLSSIVRFTCTHTHTHILTYPWVDARAVVWSCCRTCCPAPWCSAALHPASERADNQTRNGAQIRSRYV